MIMRGNMCVYTCMYINLMNLLAVSSTTFFYEHWKKCIKKDIPVWLQTFPSEYKLMHYILYLCTYLNNNK